MKKIVLSAVVIAAMMATGCQNEEVVALQQQGNVEVNASTVAESRTYVEGTTIYWSQGDKILAYGDDVLGSLTLVGNGGSTDGQFIGYVSGDVKDLEYLVYPAEMASYKDGKVTISIGTINKNSSNAPMFAEYASNVTFRQLTAMVRIQINNVPAKNNDLTVSGAGIGSAVFENGELTYNSASSSITVTGLEAGTNEICIPVFTSNSTAQNVALTFTLADATNTLTLPLKHQALTANSVPVLTYDPENKTLDEQTTLPEGAEGYVISTLTELVQFANMVNAGNNFEGQTVTLGADINLNNQPWTPIGTGVASDTNPNIFMGTFDGANFTISNLNIQAEGEDAAGLFAASLGTIKNLTIEGVNIEANYKAGAIVGDGVSSVIENCHVNGGSITLTPLNGEKGNNAGGIVGYLSDDGSVKGCSVTGLVIKAYSDLGGIVGTANVGTDEVSGNSVTGAEIMADQTMAYNVPRAANAGEVCGRVIGASIEDNDFSDVKVETLVATNEQLTNAVKLANDGQVIAFANDIKGDAVALQKADVNVVVNGNGHKYDGTIEIQGQARSTGKETLTLTNINFETASTTNMDFISAPQKIEGKYNYAHNVTLKNCNFTANTAADIVAARFYQSFNCSIEDCTASGLHSMMWATGGNAVTIDGITMTDCKNGVHFGTLAGHSIKNSTIVTTGEYGFGVRGDASTSQPGSIEIKNCSFTAKVPVLIRKSVANSTYTLTMTGNNTLNTTGTYQIIPTSTDFDEKSTLAPAAGKVNITGADNFTIYNN